MAVAPCGGVPILQVAYGNELLTEAIVMLRLRKLVTLLMVSPLTGSMTLVI